ncbi:MAG: phosphatase, partial [Candidatus Krumholzibacteria bacterium]|nr:phosphatase [Candidatus Krumholzibacteria bacterium]
WAHPGGAIREGRLLRRIVSAGVRGLEAWHPNHGEALTALVIEEARRYGLLCTGGSDYHFDEAMKSPIGGIRVPYEAVLRIRAETGGHLT